MAAQAERGVDIDASRPRPEQVDYLTTKNGLMHASAPVR
jgi:hypothetical protein